MIVRSSTFALSLLFVFSLISCRTTSTDRPPDRDLSRTPAPETTVSTPSRPAEFPLTLDASQEAWVQSTLDELSLEQCIGQMIFPHFPWNPDASPEAVQTQAALIESLGVGGYIFGGSSAGEMVPHIDALQEGSPIPLLMCAGFEAGVGLVWVGDSNLETFFRSRYPRIQTRRRYVRATGAHAAGREAGRNVVLHKPVASSGSNGRLLPGRG